MDEGSGLTQIDYIVDYVRTIKQEDNLADWLFFKLDDPDQEIWMVVKIVSNIIEYFIYYEPDEFQPGNRRDLIDNGDEWLFMEPADVHNFNMNDLEYTDEIIWTVEDDDGNDVELAYSIKKQRTMYGISNYRPSQAGLGNSFTAVTEYKTSTEFDNPEAMILETGGGESNEGGYISLLIGCAVNLDEIDVLKAEEEKPVEPAKLKLWQKAVKKVSKI